jgi:Fe-S cluster assembly protein SufD
MTDTLTTSGFTRQALPDPDGQPPFARAFREGAFELFETLPIPSPETEEWRYTDLTGFDFGYRPFTAGGPRARTLDDVPEEIQAATGEVGDRAGLAIQRNSEPVAVHLDTDLAARGVIFTDLDRAAAEHPDLVERYLHGLVSSDRTKFAALHAAFRTGGTLVYVPRNVAVELPLQTLTYVDEDGAAVFPHTLIVAEEGAEVTFIDRLVSPDRERVLSDAVVEIHAGANSRVRYVCLQEWGTGVTHLSVQRTRVERDAQVRTLVVTLGASLSRSEAETVLQGDGGSSEMLGMYFGDGTQHFDHRSIQDHVGNRTASDLLYKGALKDEARAVYTGTVIIERDAHRCDAYQTNRNVLLSDRAKADSVPNLEILTNDPVRCGHAASVGPVDETALFYLQSRGIPQREAERLIVSGFFQEVLDRVGLDEVRAGLERAVQRELAVEEG